MHTVAQKLESIEAAIEHRNLKAVVSLLGDILIDCGRFEQMYGKDSDIVKDHVIQLERWAKDLIMVATTHKEMDITLDHDYFLNVAKKSLLTVKRKVGPVLSAQELTVEN